VLRKNTINMEATLKFNLPEETEEFNTAVNASNYKNALWELNQYLRNESKWSSDENKSEIAQIVRDELYRLMSENNVALD
jgi:hypothetical protein